MNEQFSWLESWYSSNCNGDWEHDKRIRIETIDNPGWGLSINFTDTDMENQTFDRVDIERSENDWITCFVENNSFEGRCGPNNLSEVLKVFRLFVESQ